MKETDVWGEPITPFGPEIVPGNRRRVLGGPLESSSSTEELLRGILMEEEDEGVEESGLEVAASKAASMASNS